MNRSRVKSKSSRRLSDKEESNNETKDTLIGKVACRREL